MFRWMPLLLLINRSIKGNLSGDLWKIIKCFVCTVEHLSLRWNSVLPGPFVFKLRVRPASAQNAAIFLTRIFFWANHFCFFFFHQMILWLCFSRYSWTGKYRNAAAKKTEGDNYGLHNHYLLRHHLGTHSRHQSCYQVRLVQHGQRILFPANHIAARQWCHLVSESRH